MCSEIKKSIIYKPKGQKVYVLSSNCLIVGVWTNLKQLCVDMALIEKFPSYSNLSKVIAPLRKNNTNSFSFDITTKENKTYQIKVEILK